jgi:hypothetical protein
VARFHTLSDREFENHEITRTEMLNKAITFLKESYRLFLEGHDISFPHVTIVSGHDREGEFLVIDRIPTIRVFRDSNSWILTLFHEFQHFMKWVADPVHFNETYDRFKDIEETFAERHAVENWSDFAGRFGRDDLEIPGTQIATYVRRYYGRRSRL